MSDKPSHYYGQLKPEAIQCQELSQSTAWMVRVCSANNSDWLSTTQHDDVMKFGV